MGSLSLLGFGAAVAFVLLLPPSRNWRPVPGRRLVHHLVVFRSLLRLPALRLLVGFGFVLVGPFVSLYNYTGYRLTDPPYDLGQTVIGAIFLVYVVGIVGSAVFGRVSDGVGGPRAILAALLWAIVAGIALVTFGFFGAHTVASAAVGRIAPRNKGHASALYLFAFYAGMSVFGAAGGWFWQAGRWPGVVGLGIVLSLIALEFARRLQRQAALPVRP